MTVLVLGIDALDYNRVQENDYLSELEVQHLEQDLDGPNGLFTKRVWPCIFAGTSAGASDPDEKRAEYEEFEPDSDYIWESYPSRVMLPPIPNAHEHDNGTNLPDRFVESFRPKNRIERALDGLEADIQAGLNMDGIHLVVGCTRTLDIAGHHLPDEAQEWHDYVNQWIQDVLGLLGPDDKFVLVSDHGFGEFGGDGIEAHTTDAVLASDFLNYDSMTEFCESWQDDLHEVILEDQMEALGYM